MRSYKLGELTYPEAKSIIKKNPRVILPIGTIEAHGPHLPLSTDTICATGLALKISKELNAVVSPPIHYGVTNSLLAYPGSNTISEKNFQNYVKDVIIGLINNNFKEIIIVNGHGGNNTPLENLIKELTKDHLEINFILIHWWVFGYDLAKKILQTGIGHAGSDETSVVSFFAPELVLRENVNLEEHVVHILNGFRAFPMESSILIYDKNDFFSEFPNQEISREYTEKLISNLVTRINYSLKKMKKI